MRNRVLERHEGPAPDGSPPARRRRGSTPTRGCRETARPHRRRVASRPGRSRARTASSAPAGHARKGGPVSSRGCADPRARPSGRRSTALTGALQLEHALLHFAECGLRHSPIRRAPRDARRHLPEQPRDSDLEELVQVRGEDRAELHPVEQRQTWIRRELEDPFIEVEPGKLAVCKPSRGGLECRREDRASEVMGEQSELPPSALQGVTAARL